MIHSAVFAYLALLARAAVNVDAIAIAMAVTRAAVASAHSLTRIESGRHSHIESEVAMKLPAASSRVALAGRTARCSERTGFE
jgi:hypothetical protein